MNDIQNLGFLKRSGTFVVAELSGNHRGDIDRAIELIRCAKRVGADAVKFQTYSADTITLRCEDPDFLINKDSPWNHHKTLWNLYNHAQTPFEWHESLFSEARRLGLEPFSSPFDETAVDLLESLDVALYKIASPEITHIPLLERVARTGKPVILSTGLATLEDLELAIETLRTFGCQSICVLKCTSAYPTPLSDINLLTMLDFKQRFNVYVGLSDHSLTSTAALSAVSLGASVIEKHITLDNDIESVDSFFSFGESAFTNLVRSIRDVEEILGRVTYDIPESAMKNIDGRRSIYVSSSIEEGELFTEENLRIVRPAFGLHPRYMRHVLGKQAKRSLRLGEPLTLNDVTSP